MKSADLDVANSFQYCTVNLPTSGGSNINAITIHAIPRAADYNAATVIAAT